MGRGERRLKDGKRFWDRGKERDVLMGGRGTDGSMEGLVFNDREKDSGMHEQYAIFNECKPDQHRSPGDTETRPQVHRAKAS